MLIMYCLSNYKHLHSSILSEMVLIQIFRSMQNDRLLQLCDDKDNKEKLKAIS